MQEREQGTVYAILGATLIDGTGRAPVPNATVVIRGDRIETVGPAGEVAVPDGAERIEAEGKTLLPGMIDCHVHIYTSGFLPVVPPGDEIALAGAISANNLRSALQAGITTVRDVSSGHVGLAMRSAVEAGHVLGSRCVVAGRGICMTGGHGSGGGQRMGIGVHEVDGEGGIRAKIREERKAGADLIKLLTSHRSPYPEFTQGELDAAVDEAHRLGMKVAVHAGNFVTTRMSAQAGVDTIEHGIEIDDVTAEMMAKKGIILVATNWVLNDIYNETLAIKDKYSQIGEYKQHPAHRWLEETVPVYRHILAALPKTMETVKRHGVRIAAGTDNVRASAPFAAMAYEAEYLVRYGLSPLEAIDSVTRAGAEAIGLASELGTVEPGKLADVFLVDGNPADEIGRLHDVAWVMKEGQPILRHPEWAVRPVRDGLGG